jgi:opine dehydrogenase
MVNSLVKKRQKIVVIGGGHGAVPSAAFMSLLGHETTLINRHFSNVADISQSGGVRLIYPTSSIDEIFRFDALDLERELFEGERIDGGIAHELGREDLVSVQAQLEGVYGFDESRQKYRIAEAIEEADLIRVIIPSVGHKWVAEKIAPYLGKRKKQRVLLEPERTGGVIEFYNELRRYEEESGEELDWDNIVIGGAGTFVFASRRRGPTQAYILGSKNKVPVSTLPADDVNDFVEYLNDTFLPQASSTPSVLYTSFDNMGAVFHPLLTLLWISVMGLSKRLDDQSSVTIKVQHYADVTPEMGRILEAADDERMAVARAYGVEIKSARKWLEEAYGATGATLSEALNNCDAYKGLLIPGSINTRYLWEDARTSALAIAELGRAAGVDTPILRGVVYMASSMFPDVEFYEDGRTLKNMGLEGMSVEEIRDFAIHGYRKEEAAEYI